MPPITMDMSATPGENTTRRDIADVRMEIEKVRLEIEKVRLETEKVRTETKAVEAHLLKWQLGVGATIILALGSVMAKGFGWLGF